MKGYLKLVFVLYFAALAAALALRIILKLNYMDSFTGFYSGGGSLVRIFNTVLIDVAILLFVSNRLKKDDDDYPVDRQSVFLNALAILTGISMIAFAVNGFSGPRLEQNFSETFYTIRSVIGIALGSLSGLAFIYLGVGGVFGRKKAPISVVMVIPVVWQTILLVMKYNSYTTVTTISDNLLIVLFMIFNSLFLMGQARTVCSMMRKSGRNYAIPSGLCASLCGFVLVIPNYIYVVVNGSPMPVVMLGWVESAYILIMSLYALVFVIRLALSIKRV